jgi:hypothetical protein
MASVPQFEYVSGAPLEALKGDCQDVIDFARKNFGVELSFNDESIMWLSSFIEENRGQMDADTQHVASVKIGIFLGCAIIHHHGGQWVRTDENDLVVRFPIAAMAFPITKANKQFASGIADNIYGLYRNVGRLLKSEGFEQGRPPQEGRAETS